MKPRILLVDDHPMLRRGLEALITRRSLGVICGEASNGEEALRKVAELEPDLVIMDVSMPVMSGTEATRQLRRMAPSLKIVVFTMHGSPEMHRIAIQSGADLMIDKAAPESELVRAIRQVMGETESAGRGPE